LATLGFHNCVCISNHDSEHLSMACGDTVDAAFSIAACLD
jgi:hypothetical protein